MGVSAGGYPLILVGSCNVSRVIGFVPRTKLINPINKNMEI